MVAWFDVLASACVLCFSLYFFFIFSLVDVLMTMVIVLMLVLVLVCDVLMVVLTQSTQSRKLFQTKSCEFQEAKSNTLNN